MKYIWKLAEVSGRRSLRWLKIGATSGFCLALIELLFSYLLVALFKLLGFSIASPHFAIPSWVNPDSAPWIAGGLFLFAGVTRGGLQLVVRESALLARELANARLKLLAFDSILRTNRYRSSIPTTKIQSLLFDIFPKSTEYCYFIAYFIPAAFQTAILGVLLLFYSLKFALVGAVLMAGAGLIVTHYQKLSRAHSRLVPGLHAELMREIQRSLSNWFLIKAIRKTTDHFFHISDMIANHASRVTRSYFLGALASVLPQIAGTFVIVTLVVIQLKLQWIDGARFVAFTYLFTRFLQSLGSALTYYSQAIVCESHFVESLDFVRACATESSSRREELENIENMLEKISMSVSAAPQEAIEVPVRAEDVAPKLNIENLSYRYSKDSPWIVKNLNLEVAPGSSIGIMGPSGAGKSTLLALALGLLDAEEGKVSLNGTDVETYLKTRPSVLSYVGPDAFLFEGSLRQNLTYGSHGEVPDNLIWECLRLVDLEDEVRRKGGLDIHLNNDRDLFSTGQRQRLSIARSLCQQPKILILDEVTANLDVESEKKVFDAIRALDKKVTRLVVSHNPEVKQYLDFVVTLS